MFIDKFLSIDYIKLINIYIKVYFLLVISALYKVNNRLTLNMELVIIQDLEKNLFIF